MSTDNILTINGKSVEFKDGDTVLEAARRVGIYIPTLCYLKGTTNTGACRVCVVQVEGARSLVASCAMPASREMVVLTESPRVIQARRFVLAMLMISGDHNCSARGNSSDDWTDLQVMTQNYDKSSEICDAYGHCDLQELAYRYQVHERISGYRLRNLKTEYPLEDVNPFIIRDFSRCILCGRCVKACTELQVNNAISFGYRGTDAKIVARGDSPLAESDCVFCGQCVQVCPVGALVEKKNRYSTRYWELERHESTCGHCSMGCSTGLYVRDGSIVKIEGNENNAVNRGSLCARGRYGFEYCGHEKRITEPRVNMNTNGQTPGWADALSVVAGRLMDIKEKHGADSIAGIASASYTNEDLYMMQKFFRLMGTNNIDSSSRLLDFSTESIGLIDQVVTDNYVRDIETADVFLVAGSDMTESNGVIASMVKKAASNEDRHLIVADPRCTAMAGISKNHLQLRPGTDIAWIYGMVHVIISEGLHDEKYVAHYFDNFDSLKNAAAPFTPEKVEKITGIDQDVLAESARQFAGADRALAFYGTGLTQHMNGVDNVRALCDLAMLCGFRGKGKGGVFPLRSQSNSQGAGDMGCLPDFLPGYVPVDDDVSRKMLGDFWGFDIPGNKGRNLPEILQGIESGDIRALYIMGVDLAASIPMNNIEKILKKLDFLVVHDLFDNGTTDLAHVVLPSTSLYERDGTITSTEKRVNLLRRVVDAPGHAIDDWRVFVELSKLMGREIKEKSAQHLFNEISQVALQYNGISCSSIEKTKGQRRQPVFLPDEETGKKLSFSVVEPGGQKTGSDDFTLITGSIIKEHFSYARGIESIIPVQGLMNPEDAEKLGLNEGDNIEITSGHGSVKIPFAVDVSVSAGTIWVPVSAMKENINSLLKPGVDPVSGVPACKIIPVKIGK